MRRAFLCSVGVIKYEFLGLNVFGKAVYLDFRFVHLNFRIEHANSVYLSSMCLSLKDGSFPDAHADLHAVGLDVVESASDIFSLAGDHLIEIVVAYFSCIFGGLLGSLLDLFGLFVLFATLNSFLFHLFDIIQNFITARNGWSLLLLCWLH